MALAVESRKTSTLSPAPEILSDDRIEELLKEAETRLRAKAGLEPTLANEDVLALETTDPAPKKRIHFSKLKHNLDRSSYLKNHNGIVKVSPDLMVPAEQRKMADGLRAVTRELGDSKKVNDQTDAGSEWFNLPKTELTSSLKRDLQLIEMRNVLDPHRHYKKNTRKGKVPTFSQVGTLLEGPTEWYSGRINRKDRTKNFVDEEMRNEQQTGRFKRKYTEIQHSKTSGKKAHYKKLQEQRKKRS
ncbi:dTDP-fucopyranose mutase [Exophiala xenobiotica]|uniref:dTDP-fucopyranose mutase n=1 Tax=Lithohypha guttulata TaxID=1690604 RepID=A0ABR0K0Q1_9EURO|nr:dTDP-fucopyranose mutase [Lithohypha guttulata]KAK5311817.1 dTDP-fucopyranose mutase [Exophiala xenobiotica]